jgi:hypothetical protein
MFFVSIGLGYSGSPHASHSLFENLFETTLFAKFVFSFSCVNGADIFFGSVDYTVLRVVSFFSSFCTGGVHLGF